MNNAEKKSIFRALFVPHFIIMVLQAIIFYAAAVYGGIEETMNKNAADILTQRLINRKNEIETMFTKTWTNLDSCENQLHEIYKKYSETYGEKPLTKKIDTQVNFISDTSSILVKTLRSNDVNGIYLILNDKADSDNFNTDKPEEKVGICIRDLDQTSNYTNTQDLLLERAPSSIVEQLGCSLDSWWEARYSFESVQQGAFYYYPLNAAWENSDVSSQDLAYFEGAHTISDSDQEVVSYSIPLMDDSGYPYGVLGVELTTKFLNELIPSRELADPDKSCYVLALKNLETGEYTPVAKNGSVYSRCFGNANAIVVNANKEIGGFNIFFNIRNLRYCLGKQTFFKTYYCIS